MEIRSRIFFEALGDLARSAGSESFYKQLIELSARLVGCERWLVVRYARYAAPEIVMNNAMSEDAIGFYHDRLYRLDPLLRLARDGPQTCVVTLSRLRSEDADNAYFDEIFRSALIYDEISMLLPAPGGVCVALCLDRSRRRFTDREINLIEAVYPALDGLHHAHIDRVLSSGFDRTPDIYGQHGKQAVLILDRDNREVYSNAAWDEAEAYYPMPLAERVHKNRDTGLVSLDHNKVLHWERLADGFALAPRGKICIIEERGSGYVGVGFKETLLRFVERHGLTPRERDIVELVLRGYPNALIARELHISPGTVRNHRHRLYAKLDITTEREFFTLFLDEIIGGSEGQRDL